MYLSRVKCLVVSGLLFWSHTSFAQTGTYSNPLSGRENNPYSRYGIGEIVNGNNTVLRGMGNVTSAFENPYEVNSDNPASYSFLQRTTFEVGGVASTRSIVATGASYRTGTATISYLNLGIPLGKNGGMCIGFKPFSHVYYNLVDTIFNSPVGEVIRTYNGNGGLNYAYFGGAMKRKGLSIGFNAGYMFGSFRNTAATLPIDVADTNRAFPVEYSGYTQVGGLYWKGGIMYERKIDSEYTIRFGGTVAIGQGLFERYSAYQISTINLGDTVVRDSMYKSGELHGTITMPLTWSVGAMLVRNDKWSLGVDYAAGQWSSFKSSPDTAMNHGIGSGSYKLSVGGEYTPDVNNVRNYFSRMTYRIGLYYGADYLKIYNTTLPVYGVTLGGSMPFRRTLSKLHFAFDVGRLGTRTNNLLQETYVRFTLGISFNDKWFIPRKYD